MTVTQTQSVKSEERSWLWFAIVLISLLSLAALRWMLEHKFAIHADEAWYVNESQIDIQMFHSRGIFQLARWIIHGDGSRPPAYRIVVLPFLALTGYHTLVARLVTFACFLFSGWFAYLTAKRLAGSTGGLIAILVFCLSPDILQASICFSTEGALYLAIAATIYFLSAYWSDDPPHPGNWIGLGLSIGLGLLSKTTFAFVVGPVILLSIFTAFRHRHRLSGLISLLKAGIVASVVAAPWWIKNFRAALAYAKYASRGFPRHSSGPHSLSTFAHWLGSVFVSLLGPGVGILICLIAFVVIKGAVQRREPRLSRAQGIAVFACIIAVLPLVALQLSGSNYLLRHISPVLIPFAILAGILATATGLGRSRIFIAASALLFSAQFLMLIFPVLFPNAHPVDPGSINGYPWRVMIRFEQWDWNPLRELGDSCGIHAAAISEVSNGRAFNGQPEYGWGNPLGRPKISFVGNGRAFNGSQIQYPWIERGAPAPDVTWLWRYEDGSIDWQKVLTQADQSDLVVTAPNYVGQITDRQDLDNQNNVEFAGRLGQDAQFQGPVRLTMGQLDPVVVDVFLKKSLPCH